ncbi:ABC transporter permease [Natronospora cellulosivora (SeqCode)]
MNILYIAYYEFLKKIRDPKFLLIMIISPIILIFILGTTMTNVLTQTDHSLKFSLAYINHDKDEISQHFDTFLDREEITEIITFYEYNDLDSAYNAFDNQKIDGVIYFPEGLTADFINNENVNITIYTNNNSGLIYGFLNSFTSRLNLMSALSADEMAIKMIESFDDFTTERGSNLERITITPEERLPEAIDFYSVVSMLQFLLIGSFLGVMLCKWDYQSDLLHRLKTLPIAQWKILSGQVIGNTFFIFISGLSVILFSKFVYNAHWDGNYFLILGTIFFFSFFSLSLGLLIGRLCKSFYLAIGIMIVLNLIFTTASGGFVPQAALPWMSRLSPNYYAKTIIFSSLYDYPRELMYIAVQGLGLFIIVVFLLLVLSGRGQHDGNI